MITNQMGVGVWINDYKKLTREIEQWTKVMIDARVAAEAPSDAAIKEAEAWSKVVHHTAAMDKIDSDNQAEVLKEDALLNKKLAKWMQVAEVKTGASTRAAAKAEEDANKEVGTAVSAAERMAETWEEEKLREAEAFAAAAAKHEQFLARSEAATEEAALREAGIVCQGYGEARGVFSS